jgi:hypothetical protein
MAAIRKGPLPDFHEAFTQLYLGQLVAVVKCIRGDRRDGGINPNADNITRHSLASGVDEDLGIGGIARHGYNRSKS